MTPWSYLTWPFYRFHHDIYPLPLRFLNYLIGRAVRKPLYLLHRRYILLRCRFAALWSRQPRDVYSKSRGRRSRFSMRRALEWYHGYSVRDRRHKEALFDEEARRSDPFLLAKD